MPPLRKKETAAPASHLKRGGPRTGMVTPPNHPVGLLLLVKTAEVMTMLPAPQRAPSPQLAPTPIRQPTGTRTSSAMIHLQFRRLAVSLLSPMSLGKLTVACAC